MLLLHNLHTPNQMKLFLLHSTYYNNNKSILLYGDKTSDVQDMNLTKYLKKK